MFIKTNLNPGRAAFPKPSADLEYLDYLDCLDYLDYLNNPTDLNPGWAGLGRAGPSPAPGFRLFRLLRLFK